MTEDGLLANLMTMSAEEFRREHLGVPEDPILDEDLLPIPAAVWADLTDPKSHITTHLQLALDVSTDRRLASFGAAGRRNDGLLHGEAIDQRPGTHWVLAAGCALWDAWEVPLRIER